MFELDPASANDDARRRNNSKQFRRKKRRRKTNASTAPLYCEAPNHALYFLCARAGGFFKEKTIRGFVAERGQPRAYTARFEIESEMQNRQR